MKLASTDDRWKDIDYEVTHEPSFTLVLSEMYELYQKKNADYGDSFTTLFKAFGEAYAFGHIMEKVERLKSLYKNGKLENESVRDSLIDLANYTVMTIVELDKNTNGNGKDLQESDHR